MGLNEWFADNAEIAKLRIQYARRRMSRASRDHYKRGVIEGYSEGRRDELNGGPYRYEKYRHSSHPQVEVYGIEVDREMADLLVALWKLGLDTQFSCQGDPDQFIWHHGGDHASQIVFGDLQHAAKFLTKCTLLLPGYHYEDGGFWLNPMFPTDGETWRAQVTFPPAILPKVTKAWVDFEPSIPKGAFTS